MLIFGQISCFLGPRQLVRRKVYSLAYILDLSDWLIEWSTIDQPTKYVIYLNADWQIQLRIHSIQIRTVSPYCLFSALPNWFKLVYGPFGQSDTNCTLDFCPDQPGRNRMYQLKAKEQLRHRSDCQIYILYQDRVPRPLQPPELDRDSFSRGQN